MMNGGGLRMDLGGGAQVRTVANGTPPSTASAAAFGPGYTDPGVPSGKTALLPNDPFGVALWAGVAAIIGLAFIRYSLPA